MGMRDKQRGSESAVAARLSSVTYEVIGAAMRVHNSLGPGLKEAMYQRALPAAMRDAGLSFEEEMPLEAALADEAVGLVYLDRFVEGAIVVEEKALSHLLTQEEVAQVITYPAISDAPLGLLLNFGRQRLEYKRILPPKRIQDWRERARRNAWRPGSGTPAYPLIRSASADRLERRRPAGRFPVKVGQEAA